MVRGSTRERAQHRGNKDSVTPKEHHTNPKLIKPILSHCSNKEGSRASLCIP